MLGGYPLASTGTIVATATPLRVVLCPVLSEFWRPRGKFSFGIRSEVVEVKNLHDDSGRHGLFANLRHSPLYCNEYLVFHFFLHPLCVQFYGHTHFGRQRRDCPFYCERSFTFAKKQNWGLGVCPVERKSDVGGT
jgi:hypothetical protein